MEFCVRNSAQHELASVPDPSPNPVFKSNQWGIIWDFQRNGGSFPCFPFKNTTIHIVLGTAGAFVWCTRTICVSHLDCCVKRRLSLRKLQIILAVHFNLIQKSLCRWKSTPSARACFWVCQGNTSGCRLVHHLSMHADFCLGTWKCWIGTCRQLTLESLETFFLLSTVRIKGGTNWPVCHAHLRLQSRLHNFNTVEPTWKPWVCFIVWCWNS